MPDTWITLRTFDSVPQAELARAALANAGIDCQLLNAEVVSMDWLLGNAIGYIPLKVPADQLEAAADILGGGVAIDAVDIGECPRCGEPLTDDGPCPMCGTDHEADAATSPAPPVWRETPGADDSDENDHQPTNVSLAGLRDLGKSMISAYLVCAFILVVLMFFMLLEVVFSSRF